MRIGIGLTLTGSRNLFSPSSLFAAGEQGAWYDPSDIGSMFQDSAGTTPAVVGQPVGKINDKSGKGNHATQATAASRPTLQQDASGYYYLSFDGTDDSLATSSIDFTATDKLTVWAGVNKVSDAVGFGAICELSVVPGAGNPGSFSLNAPSTGGTPSYRVSLGSTATSGYDLTTFTAPISNVISVAFDIAGVAVSDEIKPRVNAAIPTLVLIGAAGTGNFGNYPLFIGRRAGATLPLSGRIYSLIVRGAASDATQIVVTERHVGGKMGIVL